MWQLCLSSDILSVYLDNFFLSLFFPRCDNIKKKRNLRNTTARTVFIYKGAIQSFPLKLLFYFSHRRQAPYTAANSFNAR